MNTNTRSCLSRFSPARRWNALSRLCDLRLAPLVIALALGRAEASPLLQVSPKHEGLLAEAKSYADLVDPAEIPAGTPGFAAHFQRLQQHYLAVLGKHPPVYYFFCTVYYTPKERGFTARRGFNVAPDGRSSLGRRRFAKDFIRAVIVEGFGRLDKPTSSGRRYVKYDGRWGYGTRPLGNRNNTLIDRKSAAVHRRSPLLGKATKLKVLDPHIYNCFGGVDFETADTGGGLFHSQIDLYWGEDDPMGPNDIFRPASCRVAVRWIVPVIVGY